MLEWKKHQHGPGLTMQIGHIGTIEVGYSMYSGDKEFPYTVSIFGNRMKQQFSEREGAKQFGLRIAEKWLTESAFELAVDIRENNV